MKRISLSILLIVTLAILFCWIFSAGIFNTQMPVQKYQSSASQVKNSAETADAKTMQPSSTNSGSGQMQYVQSNTNTEQNDRQKTEAIRHYMESQNKPIEFFGQAIDQNDNPIPGVKVKVRIRHIKVIIPAPWGDIDQIIPIEKETDLGGRFVMDGLTGDGFDIESIQRDGYVLSAKTPRGFGAKNGSFERPVVFRMWKLGDSAKLTSHRTLFGFQPDGRTYTLDLLADRKIEGENIKGDMLVRFQRNASIKPKEEYPWTLDISAVAGGLIETTDEFEYVAPENGYQAQVSFQTNSIAPRSMPDLIKDYYFTSRNGQVYGVVSLQIFSDYSGQSAILVNSRVNPNGSRNLQP